MTSTPGSPPTTMDEASKENAKVDDNTATTPASNNIAPKEPASAVEFEPPLACVRRILKTSLPSSTNVGKDASAAFARASGIFIIYLTACANDFARENRRQTITANDVLAAIKELEFEEFIPELTKFLELYRENEKSKKEAKAKKKEGKGTKGTKKEVANTPQSINSKGDESGDISMDHNDDDNSDDGDRDGDEEDLAVEEDIEDMEE